MSVIEVSGTGHTKASAAEKFVDELASASERVSACIRGGLHVTCCNKRGSSDVEWEIWAVVATPT